MSLYKQEPGLMALATILALLAVAALVSSGHALYSQQSEAGNFFIMLAAFAVMTGLTFKRDFTNLASWWSFMILLQFGVAPLMCSLLGIGELDSSSVQALFYVFAGTVAFRVGSRLTERSGKPNFIYAPPKEDKRRIYLALGMLALGCTAKLYMIRAGLFMYGSDINQVEAASQYREYLNIFANLTMFAQIVISIEYFCQQRTLLLKYVFWGTTGANIAFALLSGMKGEVLVIPFLIMMIRKLTTGRLEWRTFGGLALLLLLLFPLNSSYREEIRTEGAVTSVGIGQSAIGRALGSVLENERSEYLQSSIEGVADRLNLLPVIVFLDQERERGDAIAGDERVWMIPFYPFVPRILWKDKPILDKGRRLSIAMGSTETSSTAVTPFGDLLMMGGFLALLAGMLCVGIVIQRIANLTTTDFGPKSLFVYCVLFSRFYAPEYDVTTLGISIIQVTCIAVATGYVIYGGQLFRLEPRKPRFVNGTSHWFPALHRRPYA